MTAAAPRRSALLGEGGVVHDDREMATPTCGSPATNAWPPASHSITAEKRTNRAANLRAGDGRRRARQLVEALASTSRRGIGGRQPDQL
jgi:hypothetical protein